jgi:hypothetical protein
MKVRITNPTQAGKDTKIELDGIDISNMCTGYSLIASVDSVVSLVLNLVPSEIEIDGYADVKKSVCSPSNRFKKVFYDNLKEVGAI